MKTDRIIQRVNEHVHQGQWDPSMFTDPHIVPFYTEMLLIRTHRDIKGSSAHTGGDRRPKTHERDEQRAAIWSLQAAACHSRGRRLPCLFLSSVSDDVIILLHRADKPEESSGGTLLPVSVGQWTKGNTT